MYLLLLSKYFYYHPLNIQECYSDEGLTKTKLPTYEECMLGLEPCKYNLLHVKVHYSSDKLWDDDDNKLCKQ